MQCRETICFPSAARARHKCTLCGKISEFRNVTAGVACSSHCALKCQDNKY
jgi:hypothetical protein